MIKTLISQLLGLRYPIFQGGMAWVATPKLVAAVSEAGALGILGTGHLSGDECYENILEIKKLTTRPFGVNLMLQSNHLPDILKVVLELKPKLITTGAGNPTTMIPSLKEKGILVFPVVSSVALGQRLKRAGADGLIAEGRESGGHVGKTSTLPLIPQVVDKVGGPVIAAGGIADGRGLAAALALGAVGIQMGTRFICTKECMVSDSYKEAILKAGDLSTVVTGESIAHPVRIIRNKLANKFIELENKKASLDELKTLGSGALKRAAEGDIETGSIMAGEIAGLITDIPTCSDLLKRIEEEALIAISSLKSMSEA